MISVRNIKQNKNEKIILFILLFAISSSFVFFLIVPNYRDTGDLGYHINRILALSTELRHGVFPVRISSYWLEGNGYPSSIFYGDILLYIPAILVMLGMNVFKAYSVFILLINVITLIVTFFCMKGIFVDGYLSLLLALSYVVSPYRLSDVFFRHAVGEYCAMIFIPLVFFALYRIYTNNLDYVRSSVILAIGMTGIIKTHLLTFEMTVFSIALICILYFNQTVQYHTIKTYILSIIFTIGLSLDFVVPFLDYFINCDTNISENLNDGSLELYYGSVTPAEFCELFYGAAGISFSLGFLLTIALIITFILLLKKEFDSRLGRAFLFLIIILLLSSILFPWDYLSKHFIFFKVLSAIRLPYRFICIALIPATFLLGKCLIRIIELGNSRRILLIICFAIQMLAYGIYIYGYYTNNKSNDIGFDINSNDIGSGEEYLIYETNIHDLNDVHVADNCQVKLIEDKGLYKCYSIKVQKGSGYITIPVLNYRYYKLTSNNGEIIEIMNSDNNQISFTLPAHFDGEIVLEFCEPLFWKIADWIAVFTLIIIIYLIVFYRKNIDNCLGKRGK